MSDQLLVRVEPHELVLADGKITGELRLELGEVAFPAPSWNDFVVVVLAWWCDALVGRPPFELLFMDGPYEVRLDHVRDDRLSVAMRRRTRSQAQVVATGSASAAAFRESLISAAVATSTMCTQRGWETADTRALNRSLIAVQAAHLGLEPPRT